MSLLCHNCGAMFKDSKCPCCGTIEPGKGRIRISLEFDVEFLKLPLDSQGSIADAKLLIGEDQRRIFCESLTSESNEFVRFTLVSSSVSEPPGKA